MKARRSTPLLRRTAVKRACPIPKVNRKRKASEFARCYHSVDRVEFVKSLACVCCGRRGFTENAHIETEGMGRKSAYTKIIPLCGRFAPSFSCHARLHRHGREDLELWGGIDLERCAADTESLWVASQRGEGT